MQNLKKQVIILTSSALIVKVLLKTIIILKHTSYIFNIILEK